MGKRRQGHTGAKKELGGGGGGGARELHEERRGKECRISQHFFL